MIHIQFNAMIKIFHIDCAHGHISSTIDLSYSLLAVFGQKLFLHLSTTLTSPHHLSCLKSHLMSISILLLPNIVCSTCLGVHSMSFFLQSSVPSYLPDQLSTSYLASVLSITVIVVIICWHIVFLYFVMSPSSRNSLIFLLYLRMFTFYCYQIIHLLSPIEFLLI